MQYLVKFSNLILLLYMLSEFKSINTIAAAKNLAYVIPQKYFLELKSKIILPTQSLK